MSSRPKNRRPAYNGRPAPETSSAGRGFMRNSGDAPGTMPRTGAASRAEKPLAMPGVFAPEGKPNGYMAEMPPLCISMAETGRLLGVSRRQVYNLAATAGLPTVKVRGRRLVRLADLREWVAAQPVDPAGQESESPEGAGTHD